MVTFRYESHHEKTCLRGLQPGPTQTARSAATEDCKRLEIPDLGSRGIVLSM